MVRGLYTAYSGMINEQNRLDIITNNLANVSTVGYKEESIANQAFDDVLAIKINDKSEMFFNRPIGTMSLGVKLGEVYTDYKQGSLRQSDNTFDLGIDGSGFFAMRVVNSAGEESTKYTRDGSFKMTQDGYIVDAYGNNLISESGNLQVPPEAAEIAITVDGSIYADGQYLDKITLVDFEDYDFIEKYGDNMLQTVEGAVQKETNALLRQGFLEQSNVNSVREMVEMITITRAYEAGQKVIQTVDDSLDKAVNSIGKV